MALSQKRMPNYALDKADIVREAIYHQQSKSKGLCLVNQFWTCEKSQGFAIRKDCQDALSRVSPRFSSLT